MHMHTISIIVSVKIICSLHLPLRLTNLHSMNWWCIIIIYDITQDDALDTRQQCHITYIHMMSPRGWLLLLSADTLSFIAYMCHSISHHQRLDAVWYHADDETEGKHIIINEHVDPARRPRNIGSICCIWWLPRAQREDSRWRDNHDSSRVPVPASGHPLLSWLICT